MAVGSVLINNSGEIGIVESQECTEGGAILYEGRTPDGKHWQGEWWSCQQIKHVKTFCCSLTYFIDSPFINSRSRKGIPQIRSKMVRVT
jgi:hypothetical protein